jgi:hypothetical protein
MTGTEESDEECDEERRGHPALAIRNSARLGVDRRTATTSRTRPMSMESVPSASTPEAGNPLVVD